MTPEKSHQKSILAISVISSFMATFMASAVNVALPIMAKEFTMDAVLMSWIVTSYVLAAAVFSVPSGRLSDIIGRKRVMLTGMLIFTAAAVMIILVKSTAFLLIARVIQGLAGPMIYVSSSAMLVEAFPKEKRGHVIGISVTSVYLGLSTGPFLGGILTHNFGWRSIFVFAIPLGLLAIILILTSLKGVEQAHRKGEPFDGAGSFIYAVSMILLVYGMTMIPHRVGYVCVLSGTVAMVLFILLESKIKFPVLEVRLFRGNPLFVLSNLAALINYSSTFGIIFFMSLYLQYVKGMSPQQAGTIIMIQPILMTLFSSFAGKLSDKVNPGWLASGGMAAISVGLISLAFIGINTPVWVIGCILVFTGMGFAFFSSPNTNSVMSSVEKRDYSGASAILGTMRLIGQVTGLAISAMIISIIIGRVEITPDRFDDFIKVMRISFSLFAVMCIFGVFASYARIRLGKDQVS